MRNWAGPFGFLGGLLSLGFWLAAPELSSTSTYLHSGMEGFYAVLVIVSLGGIIGSLLAGARPRFAALLMGIAVAPAVGAFLLPGLLLLIATLLVLQQPGPQPGQGPLVR